MNPQDSEYLSDLIDQLEVEFPGFLRPPSESSKPLVLRRLMTIDCSRDVLRAAVRGLTSTWSQRKAPTVRDILSAVDREKAARTETGKFSSFTERVRMLRLKHGDAMLAMNARYSPQTCAMCYADFVPRGVDPNDPLLDHEHFTIRETNGMFPGGDDALGIACFEAEKALGGSPLERKCRARTPEEAAAMIARVKEAVEKAREATTPY